jgi:hypothetical protein
MTAALCSLLLLLLLLLVLLLMVVSAAAVELSASAAASVDNTLGLDAAGSMDRALMLHGGQADAGTNICTSTSAASCKYIHQSTFANCAGCNHVSSEHHTAAEATQQAVLRHTPEHVLQAARSSST